MAIDFPSEAAYPVEMHQQITSTSRVAIPYDDAPFELVAEPAQTVRLYGHIEIQNVTDQQLRLSVRFDLHQGFVLTVEDAPEHIVLQQRVPMNHLYVLAKTTDGQFTLFVEAQAK